MPPRAATRLSRKDPDLRIDIIHDDEHVIRSAPEPPERLLQPHAALVDEALWPHGDPRAVGPSIGHFEPIAVLGKPPKARLTVFNKLREESRAGRVPRGERSVIPQAKQKKPRKPRRHADAV